MVLDMVFVNQMIHAMFSLTLMIYVATTWSLGLAPHSSRVSNYLINLSYLGFLFMNTSCFFIFLRYSLFFPLLENKKEINNIILRMFSSQHCVLQFCTMYFMCECSHPSKLTCKISSTNLLNHKGKNDHLQILKAHFRYEFQRWKYTNIINLLHFIQLINY